MKFAGFGAAAAICTWFSVQRVNGKDTSQANTPTVGEGWVSYPLTLNDDGSGYLIDLELGSQKSKVAVILDTGSSDLWVLSPENPYCEDNSDEHTIFDTDGGLIDPYTITLSDGEFTVKPSLVSTLGNPEPTFACSKGSSYDPTDSESYQSNNTAQFDRYGSGFMFGEWGMDEVTIGDKSYQHLSIGVGKFGANSIGIMGLSLPNAEQPNIESLGNEPTHEYAYFPQFLKDNGLTSSTAFSLFMNADQAPQSNILFGAVDHSRYNGTLYTVPLIASEGNASATGNTSVSRFNVELNGIYADTADGSTVITEDSSTVILDSGTTAIYLTTDNAQAIYDALSLPPPTNKYNLYPCSYFDPDDYITFNFSGVALAVPMTDIVLMAEEGVCLFSVFGGDLLENQIIGNLALRNAYVVFDAENLEVSLATADRTSTKDPQIEVIDGKVPRAVKAPLYNGSSSDGSSGDDSSGDDSTSDDSSDDDWSTSTTPTGGSESTTAAPTRHIATSTRSTTSSADKSKSNAAFRCAGMDSLLARYISAALALVFVL